MRRDRTCPDPQSGDAPDAVSRRAMLKSAALLTGDVIEALGSAGPARAEGVQQTVQGVITTPQRAIVETTAGKVRGYVRDAIFTYKGIP